MNWLLGIIGWPLISWVTRLGALCYAISLLSLFLEQMLTDGLMLLDNHHGPRAHELHPLHWFQKLLERARSKGENVSKLSCIFHILLTIIQNRETLLGEGIFNRDDDVSGPRHSLHQNTINTPPDRSGEWLVPI
jgi:hypothetical protein